MDGTLLDEEFDKLIWNEEIPKLYAKKNNLDIETAKKEVYKHYFQDLTKEKKENWTNIDFWFKRFKLSNWKGLLKDLKNIFYVYDDVEPILRYLSKKYKLIIITHSHKHFIDIKLRGSKIEKYFVKVFSAGISKDLTKDVKTFKKILKELKISSEEIIHIGNEKIFDYENPKKAGIKSYLLDRSGKLKGDHIIYSLSKLKQKL